MRLLAVVALLCFPASASADWFTDPGFDISQSAPARAALSVARSYWIGRGEKPCSDFTVVIAPTPPGGMWAMAGTCRIVINAKSWPVYRDSARKGFCVGIVHEVGHTLGHDHDADPHSIMYGGDGHGTPIADGVVPGCERFPSPWVRWGVSAPAPMAPAARRRHRAAGRFV